MTNEELTNALHTAAEALEGEGFDDRAVLYALDEVRYLRARLAAAEAERGLLRDAASHAGRASDVASGMAVALGVRPGALAYDDAWIATAQAVARRLAAAEAVVAAADRLTRRLSVVTAPDGAPMVRGHANAADAATETMTALAAHAATRAP